MIFGCSALIRNLVVAQKIPFFAIFLANKLLNFRPTALQQYSPSAIFHPLLITHHTYLYSTNASTFSAVVYLAVAIMPAKKARVNALEITTTLKRPRVAARYRGTAYNATKTSFTMNIQY
jgi:hypothetical protein